MKKKKNTQKGIEDEMNACISKISKNGAAIQTTLEIARGALNSLGKQVKTLIALINKERRM